MKRFISFFILTLALFTASAFAETTARMPYTLQTGNAVQEGFFTGEIQNGLPHGYGLFTAEKNDQVLWHYLGFWEEGLPEGEGAIYYEDGHIEKGKFTRGVLTQSAEETVSVAGITGSVRYIGNSNTKKFHELNCASVNEIKQENRVALYSREEAISGGYVPCGRCKP